MEPLLKSFSLCKAESIEWLQEERAFSPSWLLPPFPLYRPQVEMLIGGSEVLPVIAEKLMGGSEVLPDVAEMLMGES
jgi:hypothetical protein